MASHELFDQLATAALLGTGRSGPLPPLPDQLAPLLAAQNVSPEQSLLAAAAALDLFQRAGALSDTSDAAIPAAPPETLPALSPLAASLLARIIADAERHPLFDEFFRALAAAGRRLPESTLVALLELAADKPGEHLRPLLPPIVGARGHWLISLNTDWQIITPAFAPDDFDTAPKETRLRCLQQLRAAEPAVARQLLEKSWPTESADDRARFLPALLTNLAMADEPFLEAALNDKRREVRQAAADLLARLPQSRFGLRMAERAARLVSAAPRQKAFSVLHRVKFILDVALPELTPALDRDLSSAGTGDLPRDLGEKAARLSLILASAPLDVFCAQPPVAFITAAAEHEYSTALLLGWSRAAIRQQNIDWASALITHWYLESDANAVHQARPLLRELIALLPPDRRETLLTPALNAGWQTLDSTLLLEALEAAAHPFSPAFSLVVLNALARSLANQDNAYQYQARQYLEKRAPIFLSPTAAARIASLPPAATAAEVHARAFDALHATLAFRQQYLQELQK